MYVHIPWLWKHDLAPLCSEAGFVRSVPHLCGSLLLAICLFWLSSTLRSRTGSARLALISFSPAILASHGFSAPPLTAYHCRNHLRNDPRLLRESPRVFGISHWLERPFGNTISCFVVAFPSIVAAAFALADFTEIAARLVAISGRHKPTSLDQYSRRRSALLASANDSLRA